MASPSNPNPNPDSNPDSNPKLQAAPAQPQETKATVQSESLWLYFGQASDKITVPISSDLADVIQQGKVNFGALEHCKSGDISIAFYNEPEVKLSKKQTLSELRAQRGLQANQPMEFLLNVVAASAPAAQEQKKDLLSAEAKKTLAELEIKLQELGVKIPEDKLIEYNILSVDHMTAAVQTNDSNSWEWHCCHPFKNIWFRVFFVIVFIVCLGLWLVDWVVLVVSVASVVVLGLVGWFWCRSRIIERYHRCCRSSHAPAPQDCESNNPPVLPKLELLMEQKDYLLLLKFPLYVQNANKFKYSFYLINGLILALLILQYFKPLLNDKGGYVLTLLFLIQSNFYVAQRLGVLGWLLHKYWLTSLPTFCKPPLS